MSAIILINNNGKGRRESASHDVDKSVIKVVETMLSYKNAYKKQSRSYFTMKVCDSCCPLGLFADGIIVEL